MNERVRIILTDEEWMSIINREREGLPPCCANVSALRDEIIGLATNDGESLFTDHDMLRMRLNWVFPSHDVPSPAVQKIMDQIGWVPVPQEEGGH